jgi:hypothetical protein
MPHAKYPKKQTRTVTTEYWDCGFGHEHQTKKIASACWEKKSKVKTLNYQKEKKWEMIVDRWFELRNFNAVAREFNTYPGTVASIVKRSKRYYEANGLGWFYDMSKHHGSHLNQESLTTLITEKITSLQDAFDWLDSLDNEERNSLWYLENRIVWEMKNRNLDTKKRGIECIGLPDEVIEKFHSRGVYSIWRIAGLAKSNLCYTLDIPWYFDIPIDSPVVNKITTYVEQKFPNEYV